MTNSSSPRGGFIKRRRWWWEGDGGTRGGRYVEQWFWEDEQQFSFSRKIRASQTYTKMHPQMNIKVWSAAWTSFRCAGEHEAMEQQGEHENRKCLLLATGGPGLWWSTRSICQMRFWVLSIIKRSTSNGFSFCVVGWSICKVEVYFILLSCASGESLSLPFISRTIFYLDYFQKVARRYIPVAAYSSPSPS